MKMPLLKRTVSIAISSFFVLSFFGCAVANNAPQQVSAKNEVVDAKEDYIPPNLRKCHSCLDTMLTTEQREELKHCKSEEELVGKFHFGLGMGLRNGWGLWGQSRLADYFHGMGVYHPDDMSSIILKSYWLKLNGKSYDMVPDIVNFQRYQLAWMTELQPEKMKCPICGTELKNYYPLDCAISRNDGTATVFQVLKCDKNHKAMFDGKDFKTLDGSYKDVFIKASAKEILKLEPLEKKEK